ncbi:mucin-22-like [Chironomus tepperi]|uniref:mucin-22-like n=1 Tax=Chironomus tepperi TaxID=113505 RepID=UPI00391F54CF
MKDKCRKVPGGGEMIKINLDARCSSGFLGLLAHSKKSRFYYVCKRDGVLTCMCKTNEHFNRINLKCESKSHKEEGLAHEVVDHIVDKYKCSFMNNGPYGQDQTVMPVYTTTEYPQVTVQSIEEFDRDKISRLQNILRYLTFIRTMTERPFIRPQSFESIETTSIPFAPQTIIIPIQNPPTQEPSSRFNGPPEDPVNIEKDIVDFKKNWNVDPTTLAPITLTTNAEFSPRFLGTTTLNNLETTTAKIETSKSVKLRVSSRTTTTRKTTTVAGKTLDTTDISSSELTTATMTTLMGKDSSPELLGNVLTTQGIDALAQSDVTTTTESMDETTGKLIKRLKTTTESAYGETGSPDDEGDDEEMEEYYEYYFENEPDKVLWKSNNTKVKVPKVAGKSLDDDDDDWKQVVTITEPNDEATTLNEETTVTTETTETTSSNDDLIAGKTTTEQVDPLLESEITTVGSESTTVEAELTTVDTESTTVDAEATTVEAESTTIEIDGRKVGLEETTVETEGTTVGIDVTTVETDVTTFGIDETTVANDETMTTESTDQTTELSVDGDSIDTTTNLNEETTITTEAPKTTTIIESDESTSEMAPEPLIRRHPGDLTYNDFIEVEQKLLREKSTTTELNTDSTTISGTEITESYKITLPSTTMAFDGITPPSTKMYKFTTTLSPETTNIFDSSTTEETTVTAVDQTTTDNIKGRFSELGLSTTQVESTTSEFDSLTSTTDTETSTVGESTLRSLRTDASTLGQSDTTTVPTESTTDFSTLIPGRAKISDLLALPIPRSKKTRANTEPTTINNLETTTTISTKPRKFKKVNDTKIESNMKLPSIATNQEMPKPKEFEYYYTYEEYVVDDEGKEIKDIGSVVDKNVKKVLTKTRRDNSNEYYEDSISASNENRKSNVNNDYE